MYIRRTAIKSRKDGGKYYTYRLVESRRTEKGVRQHTLLNLGVDFSLPRAMSMLLGDMAPFSTMMELIGLKWNRVLQIICMTFGVAA